MSFTAEKPNLANKCNWSLKRGSKSKMRDGKPCKPLGKHQRFRPCQLTSPPRVTISMLTPPPLLVPVRII